MRHRLSLKSRISLDNSESKALQTRRSIQFLPSSRSPAGRMSTPEACLFSPREWSTDQASPMERTLIILFLRYPDGINADELWRYWDELCDIYGSQTVYDDIDLIEDALEGICDEEKVTLYTNVSRIRRKITD